ncbi:MAG: hypothetical protein E6G68_01160, partial [Actinobacteria bacterium]
MRLGRAVLALALVGAAFATAPASGAPSTFEGIPLYDHVAVIVLENSNFDTSWGPASAAHYLNSLRAEGAFDDQYFAIGHVSLDNYIAMISGQPANPLSGTDCLAVNLWLCVQPQRLMS